MKPYLITGPESLIKAARAECRKTPDLYEGMYMYSKDDRHCLYIDEHGVFTLSKNIPMGAYGDCLPLPRDWDKLMGILAELKKPKLPEYVKAGTGKVLKVVTEKWAYDVYGNDVNMHPIIGLHPITEQEFIDGGLKELAEAGYVKGAMMSYDKGLKHTIDSIMYHKSGVCSGHVMSETKRVGFCFHVVRGVLALPINRCTLIPTLPTTSAGIPYKISGNDEIYLGNADNAIELHVSTLRYLLKKGVTGLVTLAGHLERKDLELLTK